MDHQDAVDDWWPACCARLIDEDLSVVFYDLTTIRAEGLSEQDGDVRRHGMSKEGADRPPVHAGRGADGRRHADLPRGVRRQHRRGPDAAADAQEGAGALPAHQAAGRGGRPRAAVAGQHRGVAASSSCTPAGRAPLEFILAVPGRRYGEFADAGDVPGSGAVRPESKRCARRRAVQAEIVGEHLAGSAAWWWPTTPSGRRADHLRRQRIQALQAARRGDWRGKLDAQDAGQVSRGRQALGQRRQGALLPRGQRRASGDASSRST